MKHHLVGTQKDVGAYGAIIDEVKKQMWDIIVGLQQNLIKKRRDAIEERGATNNDGEDCFAGEKRKGKEVETPGTLLKKGY